LKEQIDSQDVQIATMLRVEAAVKEKLLGTFLKLKDEYISEE
jgi:hypothetical protein